MKVNYDSGGLSVSAAAFAPYFQRLIARSFSSPNAEIHHGAAGFLSSASNAEPLERELTGQGAKYYLWPAYP